MSNSGKMQSTLPQSSGDSGPVNPWLKTNFRRKALGEWSSCSPPKTNSVSTDRALLCFFHSMYILQGKMTWRVLQSATRSAVCSIPRKADGWRYDGDWDLPLSTLLQTICAIPLSEMEVTWAVCDLQNWGTAEKKTWVATDFPKN